MKRIMLFAVASIVIAVGSMAIAGGGSSAKPGKPMEEIGKTAPLKTTATAAPQAVPEKSTPEPNISCKVDADCEVKETHNCCGIQPVCLNKASKAVDAKTVRKECADKGTASVCGFMAIKSCVCTNGVCEAVKP